MQKVSRALTAQARPLLCSAANASKPPAEAMHMAATANAAVRPVDGRFHNEQAGCVLQIFSLSIWGAARLIFSFDGMV